MATAITPATGTEGVRSSDLIGPFTLYLEGLRVKHARIVIGTSEGGYVMFSVTLPFDRLGLVKKIRPKTFGQVFFGNRLFLLCEGELIEKSYAKAPTGASVTMTFSGVMGNLAMMKYAMISPEQGGLSPTSANMVNAATIWQFLGLTIGTQATTNNPTNVGAAETAYLGASIQRDLIATRFQNALGQAGNADMAKAFREIINAFIYGASSQTQSTGINVNGTVAASVLGITDQRFKLVQSLVGITNQDLIGLFYGSKTKEGINPFIGTILGMGMVGEQNLLEILRMLAYRAYHTITEMVAPPMTADASGTVALGRMLMVPRLFSADPPLCNVFFPQIISNIESNVTVLKPTRVITVQQNPFNEAGVQSAAASVSPKKLEGETIKRTGTGTSTTAQFIFSNSVTQEETEVGVNAKAVDDVFGASVLFGGNVESIAKWFDFTGPLRFSMLRAETQTATISMEFNPFVAVGFPGLALDEDLGVLRGLVVSVNHVITAQGAATKVGMAFCVVDDALEYTAHPDTNFDTGFDGRINSYKAPNPSDVYEKILGCRSLFKARAEIAKAEAEAKAQARLAKEEEEVRNNPNATGSSDPKHFEEIQAEELKAANDKAGKEGVAAQARKLYDSIVSTAPSMEFEKEAVRRFAFRNIASYANLQKFYNPAITTAAAPATATAPATEASVELPTIDIPDEPPFQLNLKLPYASFQQRLQVKVANPSGATFSNEAQNASTPSDYVVQATDTPGPFQVFDRVGPVLDYIKSIEE